MNARDYNGYTPLHHAAARGDNELIDVPRLEGRGRHRREPARDRRWPTWPTVPVQRMPPFLDTVALLEKLGSKNSHKCKSC